jgi:hypothetical protein
VEDRAPNGQIDEAASCHALAFAFTTALRDAEAHPPVLSPDAVKIQDRIRKSQDLLDPDQQRVTELTGALAQVCARKQVVEATAESARLAEEEWQRAVPAQRGKVFSGTPGVNIKPVVGGVEISVRYITRANERFLLRAKLYQAAVDLLGAKAVADAPK